MIYEKWGNLKYKYRGRQFWCRGYYVDTAGKNTKIIDIQILGAHIRQLLTNAKPQSVAYFVHFK